MTVCQERIEEMNSKGWNQHKEEPSGSCKDCPHAGWIDIYGEMIWGCDMSFCRKADEEKME